MKKMNSQKSESLYSLPIITSNLITNPNEFTGTTPVNSYQHVCEKMWKDFLRKPVIHSHDATIQTKQQNNHTGVFFTPYLTKSFKEGDKEVVVGVIGTMGPRAAMTAMTGRQPCFQFTGYNEELRKIDMEAYSESVYNLSIALKSGTLDGTPKCHVVIVLSHSGEPEDEELVEMLVKTHKKNTAKKANLPSTSIDFHISSHSHNIYFKKIIFNGHKGHKHQIYIHQSGPYASNLGVMQFEYNFETEQLNLRNEFVKVPLSTTGSDSTDRHLYESDHLGDTNNPISLFETTGVCFDCIDNGNVLLPIRIPVINEIPMDASYLKKMASYKELINKYILGSYFPFNYDSKIGSLNIENINEKKDFGTIVSDCVINEMRKKHQKIRSLVDKLKVSNKYSGEATLKELLEADGVTHPVDLPHSFTSWKMKDIESILNQHIHTYLIPTDGLRTHIKTLKHWNESVIDLQFSDIYTLLPLGRLSKYVGENVLPGETVENFYLPLRVAKRLMIYTQVLSDVFNLHIISMCRSSNIQYKTRWWGIPFLVEDKQTKRNVKIYHGFGSHLGF